MPPPPLLSSLTHARRPTLPSSLKHARRPPPPLLSSLTHALRTPLLPLPSSLTHARRTLPTPLPFLSLTHARRPPPSPLLSSLTHAHRTPPPSPRAQLPPFLLAHWTPRLASPRPWQPRRRPAAAPTAAALKPIADPHPPPPTISSVTAAELRSKSRTAEEASDNILRGCCRSAARIADSDSAAADPPLRQLGLPWGTLAHWAPAAIDSATEPKPTIPPPSIDCLNGSPRRHPHCLRRFRIHEWSSQVGLGAWVQRRRPALGRRQLGSSVQEEAGTKETWVSQMSPLCGET